MIIKEELLGIMLEGYPAWNKSPEDFLTFITLTAYLAEMEASEYDLEPIDVPAFARELGSIFIKVFYVDIYPYQDCQDLMARAVIEDDLHSLLRKILSNVKENDDLLDITESAGIMPSIETMQSEIAGEFLYRATIEKLRPYLEFR